MQDIRHKLKDMDFTTYYDFPRHLDLLSQYVKEAEKRNDRDTIIYINAIIKDWYSSINKTKEVYRKTLLNLNRAGQDLEYFSYRLLNTTNNLKTLERDYSNENSPSETEVSEKLQREEEDG